MLTRANCLSLLHITQWVPRPVVSACWVIIKNIVILAEKQNVMGDLSPQEKVLFRAILKALALPEESADKTQPFKLEAGYQQFKSRPKFLWIWGENLGKKLLSLPTKHVFQRVTELHMQGFDYPIMVSPSLGEMLKNSIYKRPLWDDGCYILKKFL